MEGCGFDLGMAFTTTPPNLTITGITSSLLTTKEPGLRGVVIPASLCHVSSSSRAYVQPPVKVTVVPPLWPEDTSLGYTVNLKPAKLHRERI